MPETGLFRNSLPDRPVPNIEFRQREVGNVRRRQCRADPEGRCGNQTIGLVEGDAPLSEFTTPTARTLRFCGVQRRQPQRSHQPTRRQFLAGSKSAPYLLDRNRRHPWFHPDPSQSLDAISGRPTPEGIDQNRRIEHQPRHAQPDRRESPLRCARTQPAGSSSHSWPVSEIVPKDASMSSHRRSSSRPRLINSAMKALRRLGPAFLSSAATSSSSS